MNPIPDTTLLRFAVLGLLIEHKGHELSSSMVRAELKKQAYGKSRPVFYQMMARMVQDGLITGEVKEADVDGLRIKQTYYAITRKGKGKWKEVASFVNSHPSMQCSTGRKLLDGLTFAVKNLVMPKCNTTAC